MRTADCPFRWYPRQSLINEDRNLDRPFTRRPLLRFFVGPTAGPGKVPATNPRYVYWFSFFLYCIVARIIFSVLLPTHRFIWETMMSERRASAIQLCGTLRVIWFECVTASSSNPVPKQRICPMWPKYRPCGKTPKMARWWCPFCGTIDPNTRTEDAGHPICPTKCLLRAIATSAAWLASKTNATFSLLMSTAGIYIVIRVSPGSRHLFEKDI